jgi:undecaprenyl-diphosphatase
MNDWLAAALLGIVEGLTEFIPVSSTGMLLLTKHFLGLPDGFWDTFNVLIQLGAILAVVVLYFHKLWGQVIALPSDPRARKFALSIIVAFLPAVVLGLVLHDFIKKVLFDTPSVQCMALILGGLVLLGIDRFAPRPSDHDPMRLPVWKSLVIGFFQCIAMAPGVSRSGATIVGAMVMGVDKRAAAEFSFFLAIPTMLGAFVLDAWKSREQLNTHAHAIPLVAVGFAVSFVVALIVIRAMLAIVTRRGFAPFGWFRIVVGAAGLAGLYLL